MKYSVLVALLGSAKAVQLTGTPADSRKAWEETRNASYAAVAEQQRFQAEHNAMVKKNFDDDTNATDARKNKIRVKYINTLNGSNSFAQTSDPLGKANESFVTGKAEASDVVAEQERFQAEHNDMVKSNFSHDTAATDARKAHLNDGYIRTLNGQNGYVNNLKSFVQLQDDEPKGGPLGKADDTFVPGKAAAASVVATQQQFEAWKTADVAARNAANIAEANALKAHVTHERDSQIQGDFWHDPYPRRSLWAGRAEPSFVQVEGPMSKDPLGAQNESHTKGVAEANETIAEATAELEEFNKDFKHNNDKADAEAGADASYGRGYVNYQAGGAVTHNSYPRAPRMDTVGASFAQMRDDAPAEEKKAEEKKGDETAEEKTEKKKPVDPLGAANGSRKEQMAITKDVLSKQANDESANVAENKERDDEDSARVDTKRAEITKAYNTVSNGGMIHDRYPRSHYPAFVQIKDNEADKSYQEWRQKASATVSTQQGFESTKTADVASRNSANTNEADTLKTHVWSTHQARLKQFDPNVQMVYIPEEEVMMTLY